MMGNCVTNKHLGVCNTSLYFYMLKIFHNKVKIK